MGEPRKQPSIKRDGVTVRDKTRPLELDRSEALTLVFDHLCDVQSALDVCEEVRDTFASDARLKSVSGALGRMAKTVKRASAIVESLLDREADRG